MTRQLTRWFAAGLVLLLAPATFADGFVRPPIDYDGSFNERAQEAIIIFHPGDGAKSATQDMILKITVEGDVRQFAWIVPLPAEPTTAKEDAKLFRELHDYAGRRRRRRKQGCPSPLTKGRRQLRRRDRQREQGRRTERLAHRQSVQARHRRRRRAALLS